MNILFYQPYNQATIYIESIAEQLAGRGNEIYFLSHEEHGPIHINMEEYGAKTFASPIKSKIRVVYYLWRIINLVNFCNEHQIKVVYSHYQESNIISVIAQYFCKAEFILTRHHTDCAFIDNNWKEKLADRIINKLAKIQIAPSKKVFSQLVIKENADKDKIKIINYGYNFNSVLKPDPKSVENIRKDYQTDIILLSAARLIPEKRHGLLIEEVNKLILLGVKIKLLILGKGPLAVELNKHIHRLGIENHIFCLGFKSNIMDYYAAADLIVHFSESEASNSAIKEASLTSTPVMVCNDVGDFDDYIRDGQNGFILDKEDPGKTFSNTIIKILNDEYDLKKIGSQLKQDVKIKFDIENVINHYIHFNNISL